MRACMRSRSMVDPLRKHTRRLCKCVYYTHYSRMHDIYLHARTMTLGCDSESRGGACVPTCRRFLPTRVRPWRMPRVPYAAEHPAHTGGCDSAHPRRIHPP